jgi:hypothetical protein
MAQRKREDDQRELAVLFTLLLFCIAYWYKEVFPLNLGL